MKSNLKWYKRDGLLTYIDELKYKEYSVNADLYISRVNVVNFDMIHSQSCGDTRQNSDRFYQTVTKNTLKGMSGRKTKKNLSRLLEE